jgi:ribosomal protein L37E
MSDKCVCVACGRMFYSNGTDYCPDCGTPEPPAINQFDVRWLDAHRSPRCAPNPKFPDGIELDLSYGKRACSLELPYPARGVGAYLVECLLCGLKAACTTAGRPDDPRAMKLPCKSSVVADSTFA